MGRMTINPGDFKAAKIVKPGWYPTLIKDVTEELNSKKDAMNNIIDAENADKGEYNGVPVKVWFTEKFVPGIVAFFKAFNPTVSEAAIAECVFDEYKGRYIYAHWNTNRGKDGNDPPRNTIDDWAPLPKQFAHLNEVNPAGAAASAPGFQS